LARALLNGVDTHYEVQGNGAPVLFIHGGFGGAESTLFAADSPYLNILSQERFLTITYDRRNAGRSGYVVARFDVHDIARDAVALLDYLDVERAIVIGDSLGGQVATQIALDRPDRVGHLVLCETGARIVSATPKALLVRALLALMPPRWLVRLGRRRILNPPFYGPLGPATPELIQEARSHHVEYKRRLSELPEGALTTFTLGILRNYMAFAGLDQSERIPALALPVTILHGTADKVVPDRKARVLHKLIPDSELHLLPGVGHNMFLYPEGRNLLSRVLSSG
jgi:pimeloyl-ACP methyl ester carboxylesterase